MSRTQFSNAHRRKPRRGSVMCTQYPAGLWGRVRVRVHARSNTQHLSIGDEDLFCPNRMCPEASRQGAERYDLIPRTMF